MIEEVIARQLQLPLRHVQGAVRLLREGATVPFISRYRKEATGSMDEVQVGAVKEALERLTALEARRATVLETIGGQGRLTDELRRRIEACWDPVELEDLYLPYRPKRRTRAAVARERGLEPLAELLLAQRTADVAAAARRFVSAGVPDVEAALAGASDIVAERIAEDERFRNELRRTFRREGIVRSKVIRGKEAEGAKYADYFDAASPLRTISSHRYLAMRRGGGCLQTAAAPLDRERAARGGEGAGRRRGDRHLRREPPAAAAGPAPRAEARHRPRPGLPHRLQGRRARLAGLAARPYGHLPPRSAAPPRRGRRRAARPDPPLRPGGLRRRGRHGRARDRGAGAQRGARRGGRLRLSEDGASVYSASAVAREEFPDCDVTVRGAVSIGRRLIDPLSELVKIEPRSIGVGQYQHSVDQTKLRARLASVVESCVNSVGVNINTASKHILAYVSGLGPALAANIVAYRAAHGDFRTRRELLRVPRLGARAYEQAAGFLRVVGGENPLDNSAVHPESYGIVERMAADVGVSVDRLLADGALRRTLRPERYVGGGVGLPTVTDILEALDKRGLDPREQLHVFSFAPDIHTIDDLREGMRLPGIVTNITAFGAFVDIGIKQDGLVHVSQLADRYVASPAEVVRLGQQVEVRVVGIDLARGRIALTMRRGEAPAKESKQ